MRVLRQITWKIGNSTGCSDCLLACLTMAITCWSGWSRVYCGYKSGSRGRFCSVRSWSQRRRRGGWAFRRLSPNRQQADRKPRERAAVGNFLGSYFRERGKLERMQAHASDLELAKTFVAVYFFNTLNCFTIYVLLLVMVGQFGCEYINNKNYWLVSRNSIRN